MNIKNDVLKIYTDGASRGNPGPASYGFVFRFDDDGEVLKEKGFLGKTTNNRAEYNAVIHALEKAEDFTDNIVEVYSDSKLLVNQVSGRWRVKNQELRKLFKHVKDAEEAFEKVSYTHVRRSNKFVSKADKLCNNVLDQEGF